MRRICIALLLFLAMITQPSRVAGEEVATPGAIDSTVMKHYNDVLQKTAGASLTDRIIALHSFLEKYPEIDAAYRQLLDIYLEYDQLPDARLFFDGLANRPSTYSHCHAMLANLAVLDNNYPLADSLFGLALRQPKQSPLVFRDIGRYLIQHQRSKRKFLRQLSTALSPQHQQLLNACYQMARFDEQRALEYFEQLPAAIVNQPQLQVIRAEALYRLGELQRLDPLLRQALDTARKYNDRLSEGYLQMLWAMYWSDRQDENQAGAEHFFNSASKIAASLGNLRLQQLIDGNRAVLYQQRRQYKTAIGYYKSAARKAEKLRAYGEYANWLDGLGKSLYYSENYQDALNAYDKCQKVAAKINDAYLSVNTLINKGDLYFFLGQFQLAESEYVTARDQAAHHRMSASEDRAKSRIADIFAHRKNFRAARSLYVDHIDFLTKRGRDGEIPYWIGRIADTYLSEGRSTKTFTEKSFKFANARANYQKAYKYAGELGNRYYMSFYLLKLADLDVLEGNAGQAKLNYRQAYNIAREDAGSKSLLSRAHQGLGNAFRLDGDLQQAIGHYQRAVMLMDSVRGNISVEALRTGYSSQRHDLYRQLAAAAEQQYQKSGQDSLLEGLYGYIAAASSARSLTELRRSTASLRGGGYANPAALSIEKRIGRLQKEGCVEGFDRRNPGGRRWASELLAARYSLIADRLRSRHLLPDSATVTPKLPALADVQQLLRQRSSGLLLYNIRREAAFTMIILPDTVVVARLAIDLPHLQSAIKQLMLPFHNVQEQSAATVPFRAAIAHRLYRILIKPLEDVAELPPNLIIIPDIHLVNLPFEILLTSETAQDEYFHEDKPDYAAAFLQHRYAISYSPGISLLPEIGDLHLPDRGSMLIFANPIGCRTRLLPFAELEAHRIRKNIKSVDVYKREQPTQDLFEKHAGDYSIIHFATHGFIDSTFEAFSGLILASGKDSSDDGMLMGYEIESMQFDCDLVTLSACETGRGEKTAGEGVLGLPRLFMASGARSVLMTLWKVDDRFTSALMPAFYDQYINQGQSKSSALALARRRFLNHSEAVRGIYYQHPLYWGAFNLYGDPGIGGGGHSSGISPLLLGSIIVLLLVSALLFFRYRRRRPSARSS